MSRGAEGCQVERKAVGFGVAGGGLATHLAYLDGCVDVQADLKRN